MPLDEPRHCGRGPARRGPRLETTGPQGPDRRRSARAGKEVEGLVAVGFGEDEDGAAALVLREFRRGEDGFVPEPRQEGVLAVEVAERGEFRLRGRAGRQGDDAGAGLGRADLVLGLELLPVVARGEGLTGDGPGVGVALGLAVAVDVAHREADDDAQVIAAHALTRLAVHPCARRRPLANLQGGYQRGRTCLRQLCVLGLVLAPESAAPDRFDGYRGADK